MKVALWIGKFRGSAVEYIAIALACKVLYGRIMPG